MRALKEMGFEEPTDIQTEAIPVLFQGFDVIGQAKTGTGKTAVFGIYLTEIVDQHRHEPQALILAPTRELVVQITNELMNISKYTRLRVATIYGGQDIQPQIRKLQQGVHVVVATPGRALDHLERGTLSLAKARYVVIDEADRMLDMGFIDDVKRILSHTPKDRQTLLFSATMPPEILTLSREYQFDPKHIAVSKDEIVITHIKHEFVMVDPKTKYDALFSYINEKKPLHTIIFCRTKAKADKLGYVMSKKGFPASAFHGDLTQNRRETVLTKFRRGIIGILVATDLAARGLDVIDISHVINYDLPEEVTTYVHRVGRTGRAGKGGDAVSFVARDEEGMLGRIERECKIKMDELKITGYTPTLVQTDEYSTFGSRRPQQHTYPRYGGRGGGRGGYRGHGGHRGGGSGGGRPRQSGPPRR